MKTRLLLLFFLNFCLFISAKAQISGCTDPQSNNYNPAATINDGSCTYNATSLTLTNKATLSAPLLNESSGVAWVDGKLWTFNDSGNANDIYRIDTSSSTVFQTVDISNATNVDWEDMTVSPNHLFIGDFGNNNGDRQNLKIYRINKVDLTVAATAVTASIINFSYPDQTSFQSMPTNHNFDCEAMIFWNDSIHLFSKNWVDKQTKHYVIPNVPGTHVAQLRETYNAGFLVTSASVQSFGVISLLGYLKTGTFPVSMVMIYDYKNNLFFNGNKRKFDVSTQLTYGQTEGVEFYNSASAFVTNELYTNGSTTVTARLRKFDISAYLPAKFLYPKPTSNFTANNVTVCANASVTFTNQSINAPVSYQWSFPGGTPSSSTSTSPQVQYTTPGTYNVTLIATNAAGSDTLIKTNYITVTAGPTSTITAAGPTTFCQPGSVTLNANTGTGLTYQWKNNTNNIAGATNSSYVANSIGSYTCAVTSSCGSSTSNAISVTVNPGPTATITAAGATTFCQGGSVTLNANTGTGLTYQWKNNTNNIAGATNSSYSANAAGSYTCVVTNGCGSLTSNVISVTINPASTATITAAGPTTFCQGGSVTLNANTGTGLTYQWKNNTNNIAGATNSSYSANAAGSFTCVVTNGCGSLTSNAIDVVITQSPVSNITAAGPTTFCQGASVTLNANTGIGFTYQWKNNTNNIVGATTSSYVANAAGNYTCVVTSNCGSLASNAIDVIINSGPSAPVTPSGSAIVCKSTSNNTYTITAVGGATSYTWSAPTGVTITSGQGTATVNISYSSTAVSGNICVYATNVCGNSTTTCKAITVVTAKPGTPASISGGNIQCPGTTVVLSCPLVTNASSYNWTVPATAAIVSGQGTNSITVDILSTYTSGSFKVSASNCAGTSSTRSLTVYSKPSTPGVIAGPSSGVCAGSTNVTYTIAAVNVASSYDWIPPTNASIVSGQGTTTVTINFGASFTTGSLKVSASNICGSSSMRSLTINSVAATPGTISGPSTGVCAGSNNVTYSIAPVNFATGYNWIAPANATIANGQGTTTVTVNYSASFITGPLQVSSTNACGSSAVRSLTIRSAPVTPGVITGNISVCANQTGVTYSIAAVAGATTYNWTVPTGASITSGQGTSSITMNFGTLAGTVKVRAGNACGNSSYRSLTVAISCRETANLIAVNSNATIFPNPSTNYFTLQFTNKEISNFTFILSDISGREVERFENVSNVSDFTFGRDVTPGIYVAEIYSADKKEVFKVVKE